MAEGHLVADLADRYEQAAAILAEWAQWNPGAYVVRDAVGNLAVVTAAGAYVGYVDVLTGEVVTNG